ncbi:hypothetical protein GGI42DRAFT_331544 [Trichoderma sp. SZMC 28013]
MSNLSTRAHHGSNVSSSENVTTTGNTVGDQGPSSYSLDRFLSDVDRNHPPGYEQAQNPAESKERIPEVLRGFDAKFCPSDVPPQRSDSSSRS